MSKPAPRKVDLPPSSVPRSEPSETEPRSTARLDEFVERGDVEDFVSQGAFMELLGLVDLLRHERDPQGAQFDRRIRTIGADACDGQQAGERP